MCQLIVKPSGVEFPKKEYLKNSYDANSDGIGVGFYRQGESKVTIVKGIKTLKKLNRFIKVNLTKDDLVMIHFRFATAGKVDQGNTHPFPISSSVKELRKLQGSYDYIVAHNGVFPGLSGHEKLSDTQKFIRDVLSSPSVYERLDDPAMINLLNGYLLGSKLAIFNSTSRYYLLGHFIEDQGCFYSNGCYNYEVSIVNDAIQARYDYAVDNKGNYKDQGYTSITEYCEVCLKECDKDIMFNVSSDNELYQRFYCKGCMQRSKDNNYSLIDE